MPPRATYSFGLLVALLALCAGGKAILYDTIDPDCFWHLKVAEQLAQEGIHPLVDQISYASIRQPWTPYSWLAELGMKALWDIGGFRAAILAQAIMSASIVIVIGLTARAAAKSSVAAILATAFAAFLSLPYLSFRPATLAILLLAVCYFLIHRDRIKNHQTRAVWLIIPLTALLANIHLFVFLVPLWLTVLLLLHPPSTIFFHPRFLLLALTALASLATPMLPGVINTLTHYQFADPMVASPLIAEMQPFWHGGMGKVSAILVLSFFTMVLRHRQSLSQTDRGLLALSTIILFIHGRYAPLFAIVAAPIFARSLVALSDRVLTKLPITMALAGLVLIGSVRLATAFPSYSTPLSQWLNRHGPEAPGYPTMSADFLQSHPKLARGRLINEFTWGGYLAWRLGDRYQVLVDGRTQLYTPLFWKVTYLGPTDDLYPFLQAQNAGAALLQKPNSRFAPILKNLGWRTVHEDERAQVLIPPDSITSVRE